jgi:hypothetical protein
MNIQTQPNQIRTLCIPRILSNISKEYIRDTLNNFNLGTIHHIDLIRNKKISNKAFIHFSNWNDNGNAKIAKDRLLNGKDIKIIYNEPWFWKIVIFHETKKSNIEKY